MNVIHENVLVDIPEVVKEKNGIILPEEEGQVVVRTGVVIRHGEAIPEEVKTILGRKPKVIYKEYYDGGEVEIEGKTYLVMNYKDLLIIE